MPDSPVKAGISLMSNWITTMYDWQSIYHHEHGGFLTRVRGNRNTIPPEHNNQAYGFGSDLSWTVVIDEDVPDEEIWLDNGIPAPEND
jgi:hypothetical protein